MNNETTHAPVLKLEDLAKLSPDEIRQPTREFSVLTRAKKMLFQPGIATLANEKRLTVGDLPQIVFELGANGAYARMFHDHSGRRLIHIQGGIVGDRKFESKLP